MTRIRRIYRDQRRSVASVLSAVYSGTMFGMTENTGKVAILVDDMFFATKINTAAQACGRQVERVRTPEQLEALVANPPSLIIIDLNSNRFDPLGTIGFFKSRSQLSTIPIVSFVSHVQTDLIRKAQAAGCDHVLPRSAFTQMLTSIVAGDLLALHKKN